MIILFKFLFIDNGMKLNVLVAYPLLGRYGQNIMSAHHLESHSSDIIDPEFKNFRRFGDGFLLLFAVSTGEAWNEIMYDCYLAPDDCV